jgi:hypothetical protein
VKPIFPGLSLIGRVHLVMLVNKSHSKFPIQLPLQLPMARGIYTTPPGLDFDFARGALPKFHPALQPHVVPQVRSLPSTLAGKMCFDTDAAASLAMVTLDNSCNEKFAPEIRVGSESLSLPSCPASTWATSLESWLGCRESSPGWPYFRLVKFENLSRSMQHLSRSLSDSIVGITSHLSHLFAKVWVDHNPCVFTLFGMFGGEYPSYVLIMPTISWQIYFLYLFQVGI